MSRFFLLLLLAPPLGASPNGDHSCQGQNLLSANPNPQTNSATDRPARARFHQFV